jgi:hypothetical protein
MWAASIVLDGEGIEAERPGFQAAIASVGLELVEIRIENAFLGILVGDRHRPAVVVMAGDTVLEAG